MPDLGRGVPYVRLHGRGEHVSDGSMTNRIGAEEVEAGTVTVGYAFPKAGGLSLEEQEVRIRAYARSRGAEVARLDVEEGGTTSPRGLAEFARATGAVLLIAQEPAPGAQNDFNLAVDRTDTGGPPVRVLLVPEPTGG